jgi:hypothetical protein
MKTYFEKLKDPRWQRKRLEVMQYREFKCEICDDDKQELHVHHKEYKSGKEPWEYSIYELECLCADCHSMSHIPPEKIHKFRLRKWIGVPTVFIADRLFPRLLFRGSTIESLIEMQQIRKEGIEEFKEFRNKWNGRFFRAWKKQTKEASPLQ